MKKIIYFLLILTIISAPALNVGAEGEGIGFVNLFDGDAVVASSLTAVALQTDDPSVDTVSIYANSDLVASGGEPYEFDLSGLCAGIYTLRAVGYSGDTEVNECSIGITVHPKISVTDKAVNVDFESYVGNADNSAFADALGFTGTFNGGTGFFVKDGYASDAELPDGTGTHGKSMLFGSTEATSKDAQINFPGSTYNVYDLEFDFYITEKNYFTGFVRGANGGYNTTDFTIATNITLSNGTVIPYDTHKWYRLRYVLNCPKGSYDFYLMSPDDGETEYTQYARNVPCAEKRVNYIQIFRIVHHNYNGNETCLALDNVNVRFREYYPVIEKLSYGTAKEEGTVSYDTDCINIHLVGGMTAASVTADKVKITSDYDSASIDSVSYASGVITVNLKEKLTSNMTYTVALDKLLKSTGGGTIDEELKASFDTSAQDFDVSDSGFTSSSDGLTFNATLQSFVGETTVWQIATLWDGNALSDIKIEEKTLTDTLQTSVTFAAADGSRMQVVYWDDLGTPNLMSGKIFEYIIEN